MATTNPEEPQSQTPAPAPAQIQPQPQSEETPPPPSQSPPTKTILLIHGPNLNLLGHREPSIYGTTTLPSLVSHLTQVCSTHSINLQHYQSNSEGELLDRIHACLLDPDRKVDGIVINPGAYTHTSVALRDALLGVSVPFVEVHISNVHAREAFRHHSYLSDKAEAVICGLGLFGYVAAIEWWVWKWNGAKIEDAGVYK